MEHDKLELKIDQQRDKRLYTAPQLIQMESFLSIEGKTHFTDPEQTSNRLRTMVSAPRYYSFACIY